MPLPQQVKTMPPGYGELIGTMAKLIAQWCAEQPGLPDLRWHDPGDTVYISGLQGDLLKFLADSPDAFRLIEWLDEQTERKGTMLQLTWALRVLGHLPAPGMPPRPEVIRRSDGMRLIEDFAFQTGTDSRHAPSPCPQCGKALDGATGREGATPEVGDIGICVYCMGLHQYGEGMALVALTPEAFETLPEALRSQLLDARAMLVASRTGAMRNRGVKA